MCVCVSLCSVSNPTRTGKLNPDLTLWPTLPSSPSSSLVPSLSTVVHWLCELIVFRVDVTFDRCRRRSKKGRKRRKAGGCCCFFLSLARQPSLIYRVKTTHALYIHRGNKCNNCHCFFFARSRSSVWPEKKSAKMVTFAPLLSLHSAARPYSNYFTCLLCVTNGDVHIFPRSSTAIPTDALNNSTENLKSQLEELELT